jgi:Tol biopolymer transport system component/DNA-binding winged helix-turn-helix (wHTH) protein
MDNKSKHLREIGKFCLDAEKKVFSFEDKPIDLPLKEIELLCVLTENSGELITKEELLNRVWKDAFVEESNLTRHIYRLRKMFASYGESEEIIQNVPRRGYRFTGKIVHKSFEQNDDEFIVERHQKQQFIVEEIEQAAPRELTEPRKLSKFYLPVIAFGSFAVLLVFAFWIINSTFRQQAQNQLATMRIKSLITWNDEAGEGDNGAVFSPNATMIAYSMTKNGQRNIWTKQIPDGKANQITDGNWNYFNPIWSPDGQRIAFLSNRDNQLAVWSMPFSGGEFTPVKVLESEIVNLLKWSKDGRSIYYRQDFNLFSLNLDSKQTTQLTNFAATNKPQFFNISPDEKRLAYSSGPNERLHIFVVSLNGGQPLQITNDQAASDEYPFWMPDGERIIYSSKRNGIFQTCIAYLQEQRTEQLNLDITDTLISDVAANGDKVLFSKSSEESDLWQANIDEKSELQITSEAGLELWSDGSPDGKNIVMETATEAKHILGGEIKTYSNNDKQQVNIASNGFSPTYSPVGNKIAFLRYADNLTNIWIAEKDGTEKQLTTNGIWFSGFSLMPYNRVQVKDYSWSPDGKSLIYCAKIDGFYNVWQIADDGLTQPTQISNNSDANLVFSSPMFSPAGEQIAFVSSLKENSSVHLLNKQNTETVYSTDSIVKLIGWKSVTDLIIATPEGKQTAKPTNVKLAKISIGNEQTEIDSIDAAYFNNIQLSPDGQRIAFATNVDAKDIVRIMQVSNSANSEIISNLAPNIYASGITWAKDGKSIFYSRQKRVRQISMIENFK